MTSSRFSVRGIAWTMAGALCVAGAVVAGSGHGTPIQSPLLRPGAAWLASPAEDRLTLVDGAVGQPAAQVDVPVTDVVQQGLNAYAVDTTRGAVHRVDGRSMTFGSALVPISGASTGLRVFATGEVLYMIDVESQRAALFDPSDLSPRREPWPLMVSDVPGAVRLDGDGRLWAFDAGSGDLSVVTPDGDTNQYHVAPPGRGMLVPGGDRPVVIDRAEDTAILVDPVNGETDEVRLHLPTVTGRPVIGAAADSRSVYPAGAGTVSVCDLDRAGCQAPIRLGGPDLTLGTPLEAGGLLFVPDYTNGTVTIVDPERRTAVPARSPVLGRPGRFELIVQDGLVFFNDPAGNRAGVIRPDGRVLATEKYRIAAASGASAMVEPSRPARSPSRTPSRRPSPSPVPSRGPDHPPTSPPGEPGPATGTTFATFIVEPPTGGTITGAEVIDCGSRCEVSFTEARSLTLVAKPDAGYRLDHWTGGGSCADGEPVCTVTIDHSMTVGAVFLPNVTPLSALLGEATWASIGRPDINRQDPEGLGGPATTGAKGSYDGFANPVPSGQYRLWNGTSPELIEILGPGLTITGSFTLPEPLTKGYVLRFGAVCLRPEGRRFFTDVESYTCRAKFDAYLTGADGVPRYLRIGRIPGSSGDDTDLYVSEDLTGITELTITTNAFNVPDGVIPAWLEPRFEYMPDAESLYQL